MRHVTPKEAATILGCHVSSLRRWESEGKIKAIRTPGGQRRYLLEEVELAAGVTRAIVTVLYARVSTHSQQDDLERQIEFLRSRYPEGEVISEVGSGLNFRRRKFIAVLERINRNDVKLLVVAHPDRLVRFGFELVRWLCEQNECKLVVLNDSKLSPEAELVQDMLSVIHCFSSRLYGLRKYAAKTKKELQKEFPAFQEQGEIDEEAAKQCAENQGIS